MKWSKLIKSVKIEWVMKRVYVVNMSVRKRVNYNGEEDEYCVIQIIPSTEIEKLKRKDMQGKKPMKFMSLMCFIQEIYENIVEGEIFTFEGFVSWGYGTTFFCIDGARDLLGIRVQSSLSVSNCPPCEDVA